MSAVLSAIAAAVCVWTATRLLLLEHCWSHVDSQPAALLTTFAAGFAADLLAASVLALPIIAYIALVPQRLFGSAWHRRLLAISAAAVLGVLLFGAASEWFFWDEFGARFNLIAVDYLIYTDEVVGNIWQSYPVVWILAAIAGAAMLLAAGAAKTSWYRAWADGHTPARSRLFSALACGVLCVVLAAILSAVPAPSLTNRFNRELASNGLVSLAKAFHANSLSYEQYYSTRPADEVNLRALELTGSSAAAGASADLLRPIHGNGPEKHWNVIQITVESLSARYLGVFGHRHSHPLTPNLNRLATESLFFTRCFATGTRTVRGMEALTLSLPPTPGCSLVRRPGNDDLFSTGGLFRDRGYDTRFIYAGYGYFDNMNSFFSNNGFDVIDRASGHDAPVTFANIWGACDEDLYTWVVEAADKAYAAGKPFHHFVMTTSNHRPYTFPKGTIDMPQKSRSSAIRYTDYALGKFLETAAGKPWFGNTLFVIVADHCANSAGKTDIPIGEYHIPLFIYSPTLIAPRTIDTVCSQIDVAPTVLSLMNWSYDSAFYGRDILQMSAEDGRALVSTYELLGYLKGELLTVLKPGQGEEAFRCDLSTFTMQPTAVQADLLSDCISFYQSASQRFRDGLLKRHLPR